MSSLSLSRRARNGIVAVTVAAVALTLAGCGTPSDNGEGVNDPDAPILIWTDATRQVAFESFAEANPDLDITIEIIDPAGFLSKIQLANRVGSGWPDVIFDGQPNDIASLVSPLFEFAQPLNDLVDQEILDGFLETSTCDVDGEAYCLRNDLAQGVFWYNKPQMEAFGYEVPTTMEEYQALGERVAAEHPGYILGAIGGASIYYDFMWSSGCPTQTFVGENKVDIDLTDERCMRVAALLDPMLANGSISPLSATDPAIAALARDNKVLIQPAASWYGEFVFKGENSWNLPDGVIAAAEMPAWEGEDTNWSGSGGGGIYVVSRHAQNMDGAVAAAIFAATDIDYQTSSPTFPAYGPASDAWLAERADDPFYAEDPSEVLKATASQINPDSKPTRYNPTSVLVTTIVSAFQSGNTIESAFPTFQKQVRALAASVRLRVRSRVIHEARAARRHQRPAALAFGRSCVIFTTM